jgi:asparagine synthase (glutamine-hydrolysing)
MCGFVGLVGPEAKKVPHPVFQKMLHALQHRGPEDEGVWTQEKANVLLGFRRLAFSDLSPSGAQPMVSNNGRYVVVYNGETYTPELRTLLEEKGIPFRGHSDTEILLETCAFFGLEDGVKKLNGMFAFALYDTQENSIHLVRDRLGIKPLYWTKYGESLIFASELKAFWPLLQKKPDIDQKALSAYLTYGYVPAPLSIFQGIQKLEPGTILTFKNGHISQHTYWSMNSVCESDKYKGVYEDYEEELHLLLKDSISRCMVADVPVGSFLSGGIDSSLVTALMPNRAAVSTFTIGFHDKTYNEAQHAKAIAQHLGTQHHEWYITPKEAQDVIPLLSNIYDEPFADPSAIPTYLVSKLARCHLKTVLSGDGGDELFAGYKRYVFLNSLWALKNHVPFIHLLTPLILQVPPHVWAQMARLLPKAMRVQNFGQRLHTLANLLGKTSVPNAYQAFIRLWEDTNLLLKNSYSPLPLVNHYNLPPLEYMQWVDTKTYLPDDILTKLDRATMAVSLEGRVPLLDHRIVEMAWQAPMDWKIHQKKGKNPLRRILGKYVPPALFERPKMGFSVPIHTWLRTDLKSFAEDLLYDPSLADLLHTPTIHKIWQSHKKGYTNEQARLWPILMLQQWRQENHT